MRSRQPSSSIGYITSGLDQSSSTEKTITQIKVSVPPSVVGLITKAMITEISQTTSTCIRAPVSHKQPIYEIQGNQFSVMEARDKILALVKHILDEDYIQKLMTKLPIHDSTSAAVSTTPTQHNFTRLRSFSPQMLGTISPLHINSSSQQVYSDLLSPYPVVPGAVDSALPLANVPRPSPYHSSISPQSALPQLMTFGSMPLTQYQSHDSRNSTPIMFSPSLPPATADSSTGYRNF